MYELDNIINKSYSDLMTNQLLKYFKKLSF